MASYFNLILDTIAPAGFGFSINDNALYAINPVVTLKFTTEDEDTTGYQVKIWGIADAENETDAAWETYVASKAATLTDGDGLKTVYAKIRDAVGNESSAVSKTITLNTTVPVVSITGPDRSTISKVVGFDTAIINFMADAAFSEYKVMVVPATNSFVDAGVQIPNDGGSTNVSGVNTETPFPADTNITVSIKGADLESASNGDGTKIVKVFVKNIYGTWSVA